MCKENGCKIQPVFNKEGEKKGLYCSQHKKDGMIDVISKTCLTEGCNKRPSFNKDGETRPLYCVTHKKDWMVDVKSKTCLHPECKKGPSYNNEGKTTPLYCAAHKKEGMVAVKSKICLECNKQSVFNKEGETNGLYCAAHKKDGMVDVKSKTCLHPQCNKGPSFNKEGNTTALYCSIHKLEGMIDVKSKTCLECKKGPSYNKEGQTKPLYCNTHKKDGMINVISKTCIECKKVPSYNKEGETFALYCLEHKEEGMINVKSKTCKSEWCSTQVKKYDGYCLFCYMNLFPDKPVSRNYKTKEYAVVEHVKTKFPNHRWIADKIISGGNSKRRPDLLLDLSYQIVIVEVDENQHTEYDCSCQNKRIMELSQDLEHRPIVFIRFNPDDYEKEGTNITSCWGKDKRGICVINKNKQDEWTQRLNVLEEHINYWINPANTTNKTIETIQLFYDM
jgi:hypothetical protein